MHHIDYAPVKPEPFYKATGRELQPRTVGEENGVIVYNYMPISASHYVSLLQMLCFSLRQFISVCRRTLSAEVQCQGRLRNSSLCLPNIGWVGCNVTKTRVLSLPKVQFCVNSFTLNVILPTKSSIRLVVVTNCFRNFKRPFLTSTFNAPTIISFAHN